MVSGVYDFAVLDKLNWFLRDWRLDEPTKMDAHLFDIIWEVYREFGSTQPIDVLSGYRSPQTNAMLRRRSHQVAEYSQHMQGKAIDAHFVDVGTARIRDIAMRMQSGGVGFYPTGVTPWVHIDSGSVRYWPRMNRDALARLFPDGKTVFIPADGKPMSGYELARAEIEARGGQIQTASGSGFGIFAWLFGARGGGADDAEEGGGRESMAGARGPRGRQQVQIADAGPAAIAKAKRDLPTGPTYASAPEPPPVAERPRAPARRQTASRCGAGTAVCFERGLAGQGARSCRGAIPRAAAAAAAARSRPKRGGVRQRPAASGAARRPRRRVGAIDGERRRNAMA